MGNIQVKQNGPQSAGAPAAAPTAMAASPGPTMTNTPFGWERSRFLSRFMNWDPFREMAPFINDARFQLEPAFEVKETKESFVFKADVPGVKEADIDVSLKGNLLSISGKRDAEKEDKTDTYYTYERSYGSFTRSFTLPEGIDAANVRADLKDGVLSVVLPKKPEAVAKKIPIGTPEKKG